MTLKRAIILLPCLLIIGLFAWLQTKLIYFTHTQDGITWLMVNSRAGDEALSLRHFWLQCTSQVQIPIPFTLGLGRMFSWFLHPDTFGQARIMGCAIFLASVACIIWLTKITVRRTSLLLIAALSIGWVSVGTAPFYMVGLRPETLLMLGLLLFMLFSLLPARTKLPEAKLLLAIIYYLLSSWFLSIHPKAVLFAPLLLVCGYGIFQRLWAKLILIGLVVFMTWQSYEMWNQYISCYDSPAIEKMHNDWSMPPRYLLEHPAYAATEMTRKLSLFPRNYLQDHIPKKLYGEWRPYLIWAVYTTFAAWGIATLIVMGFVRTWWHEPTLRRAAVWCACIVPGALFVVAMKHGGKLYESSLILLILAFWMMIVWACAAHVPRMRRIRPILVAMVVVTGTASLAATIFVVPYVRVPRTQVDYGVVSTWIKAIPLYESLEDNRPEIERLAKRCNIALDDRSSRVIFDATTYFSVKETYLPLYIEGFGIVGPKGAGMMRMLKQMHSDGMLFNCKNVRRIKPTNYLRENELCCVTKEMIESAP